MMEDIPNVGVDQQQGLESTRSPTENSRPETNALDVTNQQPTEQAETEADQQLETRFRHSPRVSRDSWKDWICSELMRKLRQFRGKR